MLTITERKGRANTTNYFDTLLLGFRKKHMFGELYIFFFCKISFFKKRFLELVVLILREVERKRDPLLIFLYLLTLHLRNFQARTKVEQYGEPPWIMCSTSRIISILPILMSESS